MTKDMQRTHDNANYVRTSCIHDIQQTHYLKNMFVYMRVVYVRGRCDWHNLKWSPKKKWYGPSLVLGKLQEIFWWQKAKWPADPEYLMRLTYVADSWCWYDLKQPTALELTFDVSEREKNCGKRFRSILNFAKVIDRLFVSCSTKNKI